MWESISRGGSADVLDDATMDAAFESFHPDIEFREDPRFPEAGVYRGRDAVRRYLTQFTHQFDEFRFELEELLDAGDDRALALLNLRGRGKDSGAMFEAQAGWIYTIQDGRTVRIDAYLDRREAMEAAGLPD
jgi:ketosteroid isomerase-like protein